MTTVPAVTEYVNHDKGDEDQHPRPVWLKQCHDRSPLALSPRLLVNH